jgi:tRNA(fMet)-specific endonuclease VapC
VLEQRWCLSAIVVAEIRYGLEKLPAATRLQELAEATLETLEILPWSEACTRIYGRLRADLERHGKPLAAMDLLIASHALSEGCALVTADQAFAQVGELTVESW